VTGPHFLSLHTLFMNQYSELALAIDVVAERIRMLGQPTPATFLEFSELTSIKEQPGALSAEKMIATLCDDQEILMRTIRKVNPSAEKCNDFTTVDLLTQRLQAHEKNSWMLRSFINR
jgi:starvation-inducible DNA-binding protein